MPFEAYSAYFRAEELGVLAAAYDAAWQDLWTERLTLGAEQTLVLKKNLAQIILASACNDMTRCASKPSSVMSDANLIQDAIIRHDAKRIVE